MRLGLLATVALMLALISTSSRPARGADRAPNAALQYWQAFAMMPPIDKDREELLANWNKVPLTDSALSVIADSRDSRRFLRRAAAVSQCDWGLDYDDGIQLLLPYLARSRDLARLTALHARYEFGQGHSEAGAADVQDLFALARHVGSEPIAICLLVRYLIEDMAIDLLASRLSEMKVSAPKVIAAYDALPRGATLQEAYLTMEKQHTVGWLVRNLKDAEAKKNGGWRAVWQQVLAIHDEKSTAGEPESLERAVSRTEALLPLCDQLAELVALPRDQFDARSPEVKRQMEQVEGVLGRLLTTPDRVRAVIDRNQARIAMLKAATAVVRKGKSELKDFVDPFGNGPFEYAALENGFELRSKLSHNGRPVTLSIGSGFN